MRQASDFDLGLVRELVLDSADRAEKFGSRKAFISSVYDSMPLDYQEEASLEDFKDHLLEWNRAGAVSLARADLVGAMDPDLVAASEIALYSPGRRYPDVTFHFVEIPKGLRQNPFVPRTQRMIISRKTRKRVIEQLRVEGYDIPRTATVNDVKSLWAAIKAGTAPEPGEPLSEPVAEPSRKDKKQKKWVERVQREPSLEIMSRSEFLQSLVRWFNQGVLNTGSSEELEGYLLSRDSRLYSAFALNIDGDLLEIAYGKHITVPIWKNTPTMSITYKGASDSDVQAWDEIMQTPVTSSMESALYRG